MRHKEGGIIQDRGIKHQAWHFGNAASHNVEWCIKRESNTHLRFWSALIIGKKKKERFFFCRGHTSLVQSVSFTIFMTILFFCHKFIKLLMNSLMTYRCQNAEYTKYHALRWCLTMISYQNENWSLTSNFLSPLTSLKSRQGSSTGSCYQYLCVL